MFGIVLWSDPARCKAVIWCEDHRGLAYVDGGCGNSADTSLQKCPLDSGDLVEFELSADISFRRALNPRRVAAEPCPTLVHRLLEAHEAQEAEQPPLRVVPDTPNAIRLPRRETSRDAKAQQPPRGRKVVPFA
ncbi:hypothetical protein [Pseudooceanicola aestuarii]|uniref:hypothetical protein n=1 Tax=Pseudooceanicola aestuarii TaxID=2697319 RepID=UPI0013D04A56|nr:hypothetical protein [Pseudooceanicola aestuarii]